jgi:branched-subunit amino acid transport protein
MTDDWSPMTDQWLTIIAMGVVTFALRVALVASPGRLEPPALARQALRLVPPAVLSAIILPALLRPAGRLELSLGNARILAGVLAAVIAWRTKNVVVTIAVGMAALWLLQRLF